MRGVSEGIFGKTVAVLARGIGWMLCEGRKRGVVVVYMYVGYKCSLRQCERLVGTKFRKPLTVEKNLSA